LSLKSIPNSGVVNTVSDNNRNGIIGEVGYENSPVFLLPFFFFLEKREIRKRQGR
jgi:hypothetical protein